MRLQFCPAAARVGYEKPELFMHVDVLLVTFV